MKSPATNGWRAAWVKSIADKAEKPDPGYDPISVIQKELDCEASQARKIVSDLCKCGMADMKKYKVMTSVGLRRIPHYKKLK